MDPYDGYTSDEALYSSLFLVFAATFAITAVIVVISWVLIAIPLSALFRKTGIEPWKAWIPFYSTYTWLRLGGQNGNWVWLSLIPYGSTVTAVFLYVGMYRTGKAFAKETGFLVLGIFLPWVWLFMLGFGRDEYRPELIAAAGLPGPLEGHGARVAADGITVPLQYGATPYRAPADQGYSAPNYSAQPYPAQSYTAQPYTAQPYPAQTYPPPSVPPVQPGPSPVEQPPVDQSPVDQSPVDPPADR